MGYSVELTCHVEAYPRPTINWVHEGIQLSTNQVSFTISLSGFYDQSQTNSALLIVFWSVELTVIIDNIPPALSLKWPACLLKFYRKQKRWKFYDEKS